MKGTSGVTRGGSRRHKGTRKHAWMTAGPCPTRQKRGKNAKVRGENFKKAFKKSLNALGSISTPRRPLTFTYGQNLVLRREGSHGRHLPRLLLRPFLSPPPHTLACTRTFIEPGTLSQARGNDFPLCLRALLLGLAAEGAPGRGVSLEGLLWPVHLRVLPLPVRSHLRNSCPHLQHPESPCHGRAPAQGQTGARATTGYPPLCTRADAPSPVPAQVHRITDPLWSLQPQDEDPKPPDLMGPLLPHLTVRTCHLSPCVSADPDVPAAPCL